MTPDTATLELIVETSRWASVLPPIIGLVGIIWLLQYLRSRR